MRKFDTFITKIEMIQKFKTTIDLLDTYNNYFYMASNVNYHELFLNRIFNIKTSGYIWKFHLTDGNNEDVYHKAQTMQNEFKRLMYM